MATINLPTKPRPAQLKTPRRMIIFSKPKVGKTFTVSKLPDCLILDFEEGTLAIEAMALQVKKFSDIPQICKAIIEAGNPYKYIAIDTASALEEMCTAEAERRYASTTDGKRWFMADPDNPKKLHPKSGKRQFGHIINLPYGKGYALLNEVFQDAINMIEKVAPTLILLAHSTYASVNKEGVEFSSLDIQMSKKNKFSATFKADAIGYMYREGKKNFINFTASEDVGAGGRHRYLEKEHILISEFTEDDKGNEQFVTYWDKIFSPEKVKSKK